MLVSFENCELEIANCELRIANCVVRQAVDRPICFVAANPLLKKRTTHHAPREQRTT
jgi:hypothetical protein